MLPYFWYILKAIICSGILFGYYWLFLRNKIFHQYNRFYLLAALTLSLLLPILKINFWQQDTQQSQVIKALQVVSAGDEYMSNMIITASKDDWSIQQFYPIVYWMVSFIFFMILLRTLFIIRSLLKKYPVQLVDKFSFVNTDDKSTPFSFLKYIFWNANIDMDTTTGKQIFKHEVAHIQEKHTYDKLFVNILLVFFWCNPFFWLYRKELNMIHEFIADKKAVEDSDTASFAAMILQAAYPQHRFQLANNFFYSPIKRRLLMLTKNNNPKVNYIGRIMVLPLVVLIFAAFTLKTKSADTKNNVKPGIHKNITEGTVFINDTFPSQGILINAKLANKTYLQSDEYKTKALIIVDSKEVGNVGCDFIDKSNDNYSSVMIYDPAEAQKIYGEKGKYGVIKLTQKDITFITAKTVTYDEKDKTINLTGPDITLKGGLSTTAIYVDGKLSSEEELNKISPEKISSINIIKGEKLDEFVEAKGKTAMIQVNLKPADLAEVVVVGHPIYKDALDAIALDKMNVFYIGVDNPVTINGGVPNEKLLVSIDKGSIKGSNGKYIVRVTQIGDATITVATIKNDKKVLLGTFHFKVKILPEPSDPDFPAEFKKNLNLDDSKISLLLQQKQFSEQQDKIQLDLNQRKFQEQEILALSQKLSLLEQQNKAKLGVTQKSIAEKKLTDQELQSLKLKLSLLEQQNKTALKLNERTLAGVQLTDHDLQSLNQKIASEQLSKLKYDLAERTVVGTQLKSKEQEALNLTQKQLLGLQLSKVELDSAEKLLLEKSHDAYLEKALLYQTEIQAQQNNLVFVKTEVSPQFAGGDAAWRKYLEKNLNPSIPLSEGWKAGKYILIVKFIVHTDGSVSNVEIDNHTGSKTAQHCIDIIKNGPKWLPAVQNGKNVNAYKRQPITFVIEE